jgi:hypothetical protein
MGFWGTFGAEALAGIAVAIAAVFLAWRFTDRYAAKRETERARRERDLAAAADLYQVLGKFFAAWKVWDFHSRDPGQGASPERLSELVADAAVAEGGCESFITRVVLEHDLSRDQKEALWCLRFALKELRRAIRDNEPLTWWRSENIHGDADEGFRAYQAFKEITPIVVRILTQPSQRSTWRSRWSTWRSRRSTHPSEGDRGAALKEVTGDGDVFPGISRFAELEKEERAKQTDVGAQKPERWVLLAEQLGQTANLS